MFRKYAFAAFVAAFALVGAARAASAPSPASEIGLPDMASADPKFTEALEKKRQLTIQLPGFSHHFDKPRTKSGREVKGREFNENNWGIGFQLEDPLTSEDWQNWVRKTSGGVMKDSLDAYGLYAGVTLQKRVYNTERFSADLGGGAFLFYRTLQFDGKHLLVPAVLPVVSGLHKPTGLGANIVFIPRFKTSKGTMPAVVYLQFTKEFN